MKYIPLFALVLITAGCSSQSDVAEIKQNQIKSMALQHQLIQEQKITNELLKMEYRQTGALTEPKGNLGGLMQSVMEDIEHTTY